jgi:hypothetical protein
MQYKYYDAIMSIFWELYCNSLELGQFWNRHSLSLRLLIVQIQWFSYTPYVVLFGTWLSSIVTYAWYQSVVIIVSAKQWMCFSFFQNMMQRIWYR